MLNHGRMGRIVDWLSRLLRTWRAFGTRAAARFLYDRVLAHLLHLDVEEIVWLPRESVRIGPESAPGFEFRFLTAAEVEAFAAVPGNHLTPYCADRIRGGRDFCYAALAPDGRLAAYGWYALDRVAAEHACGTSMQLPEGVAYMYKGFTHPDFRGARLHGAGMGGALLALEPYGVRALVSLVHWANYASLRSCARIGYSVIGRTASWSGLGRRHVRVPRPEQICDVRFGVYCVPEVRKPELVVA